MWSDVLTWRNAIYNVVINAFKHMGDIAPHLHQLGYKDKAWCGFTCLLGLYFREASPCISPPTEILPPAGLQGQSLIHNHPFC